MSHIDDVASLSAMRHAQAAVVTASTDSIDFLQPIKENYEVCLESFVTWTHKTSMEVFVKILAEDLMTATRTVCATAFLTFVALDTAGHPTPVPAVIPETTEETLLHQSAPERADARRRRRIRSKEWAEHFSTRLPWE